MIWVFAALMTLTVILWLTHTLWRSTAPAVAAERAAYDLAVYRDQLAELDRDLSRGLIGAAEAEGARAEIARRMLAADRAGGAADATATTRAWPAIALAAVLPLAALAFYAQLGRPSLPAQPASERSSVASLPPEQQAQMIRGMVDSLAARLAVNPDDLVGWRRLSRSYRVLGEMDKAREAAAQAARLAPTDIEVLAELAELHAPAGPESELSPVLLDTLRRMLEIQPDHVQALFFLGIQAMRDNDPATARGLWERLLKAIPADSPAAAAIRQQLDALPK